MTDDEAARIEAENEHALWIDVVGCLTMARRNLQHAQGHLEDLRKSDWADLLQPLVDQAGQAEREALEEMRAAL